MEVRQIIYLDSNPTTPDEARGIVLMALLWSLARAYGRWISFGSMNEPAIRGVAELITAGLIEEKERGAFTYVSLTAEGFREAVRRQRAKITR